MDTAFIEHEITLCNSVNYVNELAIQTEILRQKIEADQLFFTSILSNENT